MSTINKTIVISTNDDPNYINYWPYVTKAWNKLGWNTLTFYLGANKIQEDINNKIVKIDPINEYRDETVVQVSRLFGHKHIDYGIIMTSDVDMMPLSDYWKPKYEDITVYGFDLTNYKQIPICYIAMNSLNWEKIIPENSIEELLNKYDYAKSDKFNEYWYSDQQIITEKILKHKYIQIDRKKNKRLAFGRIDRSRWNETKNDDTIKIDAHLPRPFNQKEVEELFKKYYN
jgi:hypothetical protein